MKVKGTNGEILEVSTTPIEIPATENRLPEAIISRLGEVYVNNGLRVKDELKNLGFKYDGFTKKWSKKFGTKEELMQILSDIKDLVVFLEEAVEKIPLPLIVYQRGRGGPWGTIVIWRKTGA